MDQDLELMRKLLNLNERIEELKWQRKLSGYYPSASEDTNFSYSSGHVLDDVSEYSCSDVEEASEPGCEADDPKLVLAGKYPSPSSLSMYGDCSYYSTQESLCGLSSSRNLVSGKRSRPNSGKDGNNNSGAVSTSDLGSSGDLPDSRSDLYKHKHLSQSQATNVTLSDSFRLRKVRNIRLVDEHSPSTSPGLLRKAGHPNTFPNAGGGSRGSPNRSLCQKNMELSRSVDSPLGEALLGKLLQSTDKNALGREKQSLDSGIQENDGIIYPEFII